MRHRALAIGAVVASATFGSASLADSSPPASQSGAVVQSGLAPPCGLAVVAFPGGIDSAWTLARAVYADKSLGPCGIDEEQARVLCGEVPPNGAPATLRELADTVAALRGDDAPTHALLGDIARRLSVRAIVAVWGSGEAATARVFLPDVGIFDAATYAPDPGQQPSWSSAVQSLARSFSASSQRPRVPALATRVVPDAGHEARPRQFYESPWFWGGIGAAALIGGGAIFFAARDSGAPAIHLEMQLH
jgi:hypothetical protein